jgi:hypothetical protein
MGADAVHPIIQTDPFLGQITFNDQSRILVGDDPDLPVGSIADRVPVPESIHFRWSKRLVARAERTESAAPLNRLDEKISRSLPSLLGDDYPSAKYRISSKFRHALLQTL